MLELTDDDMDIEASHLVHSGIRHTVTRVRKVKTVPKPVPKPVLKPVVLKPVVLKPVVLKPVVPKPVVLKPVVLKPAVPKPVPEPDCSRRYLLSFTYTIVVLGIVLLGYCLAVDG